MGFHQTTLVWPEGKFAALTTSWDDGTLHDRRLVSIFNRFGVKGTFNLNAAKLVDAVDPASRYLAWPEIPALFAGHEIAGHTANHPWLEMQPDEGIVAEIMRDRAALEQAAGYPVKGMALPFGTYSAQVLTVLRAVGMAHCRTTRSTGGFALPEDFLEWHPTCHQADEKLFNLLEAVAGESRRARLFYVWGHSYEFDRDQSWERFDDFCARAGGDNRFWHATNMEIVRYWQAWRSLAWTVDGRVVHNPSATTVWVRRPDATLRLEPGTTVTLP